MTSDNTPAPFETTASSIHLSSLAPWRAFSHDTGIANINDCWHSSLPLPVWLKIKMDKQYYLTDYDIHTRGIHLANMVRVFIRNWTIQGSTDNINWDILHTITGYNKTPVTPYEKHKFTIPKPTKSYRWFMLHITQSFNSDNYHAAIGEWMLYGYPAY